jgi:hypothetical protein
VFISRGINAGEEGEVNEGEERFIKVRAFQQCKERLHACRLIPMDASRKTDPAFTYFTSAFG